MTCFSITNMKYTVVSFNIMDLFIHYICHCYSPNILALKISLFRPLNPWLWSTKSLANHQCMHSLRWLYFCLSSHILSLLLVCSDGNMAYLHICHKEAFFACVQIFYLINWSDVCIDDAKFVVFPVYPEFCLHISIS